jgi:serine/threonine protein kinase
MIAEQISHYRIIHQLGAGGMGEVYLAFDTRLDRNVALKLLPARFTQDADRVRRFIQEAKAASALNHPNIITIHEIGEVSGTHFIATEFIDGQTLRERMANEKLKLTATLDLAMQIAPALSAAHEAACASACSAPTT